MSVVRVATFTVAHAGTAQVLASDDSCPSVFRIGHCQEGTAFLQNTLALSATDYNLSWIAWPDDASAAPLQLPEAAHVGIFARSELVSSGALKAAGAKGKDFELLRSAAGKFGFSPEPVSAQVDEAHFTASLAKFWLFASLIHAAVLILTLFLWRVCCADAAPTREGVRVQVLPGKEFEDVYAEGDVGEVTKLLGEGKDGFTVTWSRSEKCSDFSMAQWRHSIKVVEAWPTLSSWLSPGLPEQEHLLHHWRKVSMESHIKTGSRIMCLNLLLLLFYRAARLTVYPSCLTPNLAARIPELIVLAVAAFATGYQSLGTSGDTDRDSVSTPTEEARVEPASSHAPFWAVLAFLTFYALALTLPPFQWSCGDLDRHCASEVTRDTYVGYATLTHDCSLQGKTATLLLMSILLLSPWVVPEYRMMHFFWLIGISYNSWSFIYATIPGEEYFSSAWHICGRSGFLGLALIAATAHKWQLETSEHARFLAKENLHKATARIYRVLKHMLPKHVIKPRLVSPDKIFSEDRQLVSILFVEVHEFDDFCNEAFKTPRERMVCLNRLFSHFDRLCKNAGVTKIESVNEEYVCCIGLEAGGSPETHHQQLGRLMDVAVRMLDRPWLDASTHITSDFSSAPRIELKMGVHTGPIKAGIVGKRLPRYRLFGDTINMAARMMQKSEPGQIQFGFRTKELLETLPGYTGRCERRPDVEMKGKQAKVEVWWLKTFVDAEPDCVPSPTHTDAISPYSHEAMRWHFTAARHHTDNADDAVQEDQESFQEVCEIVNAMHHDEFTGEEEMAWYTYFHAQCIGDDCATIKEKFGFLTSAVALVTMVEIVIVADISPQIDWSAFFGLRGASIAVLQTVFVACRVNWFHAEPLLGQAYLVFSRSLVIILFAMSYFYLMSELRQLAPLKSEQAEPRILPEFVAKRERAEMFCFHFVLMFFTVMRVSLALRNYSIIFILVSLGIAWKTTGAEADGFNLTEWGASILLMSALMNTYHCHQEENINRLEYKSKRTMDAMKESASDMVNLLMPPQIASVYSSKTIIDYQDHDRCTVVQSDLCGFTAYCTGKTPEEVFTFIGEIFGMFDAIAERKGIYKVETVGDAYIAAMGDGKENHKLTERNSPTEVIMFGVEMIRAVKAWSKRKGSQVQCRVGVHHGGCVGGMVGTNMQRYHLYGPLMSVVEVLESTAPESGVQVSEACYEAVDCEFRDAYCASLGNAPASPNKLAALEFTKREGDALVTSKGKEYAYRATGGDRTYILTQFDDLGTKTYQRK